MYTVHCGNDIVFPLQFFMTFKFSLQHGCNAHRLQKILVTLYHFITYLWHFIVLVYSELSYDTLWWYLILFGVTSDVPIGD